MGTATAIALLLILALIAANLPWFTDRVLFFLPTPPQGKREWVRITEWLLMFGLTGLIAAGIEYRVTGDLHNQDWEFWVVTLCLFAVLALPGFIYCHDLRWYLRKRR